MKHGILFYTGLLLIIFFPMIFSNQTIFFGDTMSLFVPGKVFTAQTIHAGNFPFWNPHILSGTPWFADINQSVLYPSTLLFLLLSPAHAINLAVVLHLFLMAIGIYWVTRVLGARSLHALASGIVFMLSSTTIAAIHNLSILQTITWAPYVLASVILGMLEKNSRAFLLLPLFTVLMVLGGHIQIAVYFMIFVAGFVLWCVPKISFIHKLKKLFVPTMLVSGILMVVVIPSLELGSLSTRVKMTTRDVLEGSMHPLLLVQSLIPNFFREQKVGMAWGPEWDKLKQVDPYISVLAMVGGICLFWKRKKLHRQYQYTGMTGVVFLILSMGKYVPFFSNILELLPILRIFRNPNMLLFLFTFCMSLLLDPILQTIESFPKKRMLALMNMLYIFAILLLIISFTASFWFSNFWRIFDEVFHGVFSHGAFHTLQRDQIIFHTIVTTMGVTTVFVDMQLFCIFRKTQRWQYVFLLFLVAEMWFAAHSSLLFAPSTIYSAPSEQAEFLKRNQERGYRYISVTDVLPYADFFSYFHNITMQPPFAESRFTGEEHKTFSELTDRRKNLGADWGMVSGLSTPVGYSAFVLHNAATYWSNGKGETSINAIPAPKLHDSRLIDQSVRYLLLDRRIYPDNYLSESLPTFHEIGRGDHWMIFERKDVLPIVQSVQEDKESKIHDISIQVNTIQFTSELSYDEQIVIRENYYPGWQCRVGGIPCHVQQGDGGMKVLVPSGTHEITLTFMPTHFYQLLAISVVSVLAYLAWAGWRLMHPGTIQT